PAVPDGHGAGQAGRPASALAAIRPAPRGAEEAPVAGTGEGTGVPGRAPPGGDVERGGAREPAVSQDAEVGVPGADATGDRGPAGVGPPTGTSRRRPRGDHSDSPQGAGGMRLLARFRCVSVWKSCCTVRDFWLIRRKRALPPDERPR